MSIPLPGRAVLHAVRNRVEPCNISEFAWLDVWWLPYVTTVSVMLTNSTICNQMTIRGDMRAKRSRMRRATRHPVLATSGRKIHLRGAGAINAVLKYRNASKLLHIKEAAQRGEGVRK